MSRRAGNKTERGHSRGLGFRRPVYQHQSQRDQGRAIGVCPTLNGNLTGHLDHSHTTIGRRGNGLSDVLEVLLGELAFARVEGTPRGTEDEEPLNTVVGGEGVTASTVGDLTGILRLALWCRGAQRACVRVGHVTPFYQQTVKIRSPLCSLRKVRTSVARPSSYSVRPSSAVAEVIFSISSSSMTGSSSPIALMSASRKHSLPTHTCGVSAMMS